MSSFVECDSCRAKPGSPTLCGGCLSNRSQVAALESRLAEETAARQRAERKVDEVVTLATQQASREVAALRLRLAAAERELAAAGVRGSPPGHEQTTIGGLLQRAQDAEAQARAKTERLAEAETECDSLRARADAAEALVGQQREALVQFQAWADGFARPTRGMGSGLHAEMWPLLSPSGWKRMLEIAEPALAATPASVGALHRALLAEHEAVGHDYNGARDVRLATAQAWEAVEAIRKGESGG